MNSVIRTDRLTLRPMRAEDTDRIIDLLNDRVIAQNYMLPDFAAREDALPLAQRMIALSEKDERVVMGIDLDGEIIGWINDTGIEGKSVEVLFETTRDGYTHGHTDDFIEVKVKTHKKLHGLFRKVKLISHDGDICEGVFEDQ